MARAIVIGAGIGGLTTAAVLARAGLDVIVLEAQIYSGSCAGTFFHQGYRFDSGAMLPAGFYPGGPMERVAQAAGIDAFGPVAAHLRRASERLRLFVDAQLLISAQVTSDHANALYGAGALDLPRRGVTRLSGGMGGIAETLVSAVRRHGGRVLYRHDVARIQTSGSRSHLVETKRDGSFPADLVIANLTPWNTADLFDTEVPKPLRRLPSRTVNGWGAFMVYIGLDGTAIPQDAPLHHQIILRWPLEEGNSVFASLNPAWDANRTSGQRALPLCIHANLDEWWRLYQTDISACEARKAEMAEKVLAVTETAIPGIRAAARLMIPATPVTFQRFTRRKWGWVGGFPQTGLLRTLGPRLGRKLWLVGDFIFPGQSTAAVALGGRRVAKMALRETGVPDSIALSQSATEVGV